MTKFRYNDLVKVIDGLEASFRPAEKGVIVAIISDRTRWPLGEFPPGVVYSVEFEDGVAIDLHELWLTREG